MFEKKRGTRFLASVMALVMLLSLAPVGALAADDEPLTTEECSAMPLPANEDNPKPVVTDEENTENTNELTPPPRNENYAETPADNNGASTAISEMSTDTSTKSNAAAGQTAYFYALLPDVVLPSGKYLADRFWYGMGTGSIANVSPANSYQTGTKFNSFLEIDGKITYPSEFPSLEVGSKEYTYDKSGMTKGTYSILWNTVVVEDGANKGLNKRNPEISSKIKTYHVDGTIILNETDKYTVMFACQYPNSDKFEVLTKYAYRVDTGYQESVLTQPNMEPISGYRFDGWYRNKECTDKVNFDGNGTITENVTYYGKYVRETYTIDYVLNEGTNPTKNPTTYTYGEGVQSFADATKSGFTFGGWYSDPEFKNKVESISTTDTGNKTLYAKWTVQTATTKTQAMYFVLLPNRGTPKNNADQGEANYLPSGKYDGGVGDLTQNTGYPGYLTEEGMNALSAATSKSITDTQNGVSGSYLEVPSNLGFFTPGNWNGSSYDKEKTKTTVNDDTIKSLLGENFNVNGIQIVWYTIKNQGDGIHVDGYVKNVAIDVTYHSNFDTDMTYTDATKTGTNYSVKDYTETGLLERSGYTFAGWYTEASCDNAYTGGVLMSNLHLYAKWTPKQYTYTVEYYYNGVKNDSKTENGSAAFGSQVMNYTDKNITGYKFAKVEGLPLEISANAADNVIKVYYVKDDSQKKELMYTVEYYKNNKKVSSDTQVVKEEVWVNAADTLTVEKSTINTTNKYPGYTFEKTDPATIPDTINNNGVIKVYYTETENPPAKAQYTVKHYKWDTQKKEYTLANTDVIDSTVGTVVTAKAKAYDGGYILNEQKSKQTKSGTVLEGNTLTLKLYYDVDKIGKGENLDQPDGTIDRYQVTIIYKSSDESKGTVSTKKEVLTIKKADNEKTLLEDVMIKGSKATDNGGRNYFSNWTDEVNNKTINDATLTADAIKKAIETAEGGETYTFTANFERSSGGGSGGSNRPKPPVVEIPDDVPTGLNGKDHYAYIIGYGNNDVRPQNNITRAEVATIFFRLLTDETRTANMTKSNGYNDVKDGDWFCCAVSTLSKMGIIKGYEDGSFKPNDPISRAEFAAIAARFDPDGDKTPATFADVTSHWAKDEISIAANHGWIKGYEDGSFKPDQKITRAETMTLVNRVLNRLPETKDDLHKDMKTWVDNMDETAWYYLAVQEATNSHYFKNKTGTKFEQWTELRDTRDWSELEK